MEAWFPEEYLTARNTDITRQYDYAKETAQRRYYQLIKHYKDHIKTLRDLVEFPLRFDIHKNDAAMSVYKSKINDFDKDINKNPA